MRMMSLRASVWAAAVAAVFGVGVIGDVRGQEGAEYRGVIFSGQAAPGGGTVGGFSTAVIGDDGRLGLVGWVQGESETADQRVWSGASAALGQVAANGATAPGVGGPFDGFERVSVASDGGVGFRGNAVNAFENQVPGIWTQNTGALGLGLVADQPFPSPTGGDFVTDTGDPAVAAGGAVAVKVELISKSEETSTALAMRRGGVWDLVLAEGDPAPGAGGELPAGSEIANLFASTFATFEAGNAVDMNDAGQVAFKAIVVQNSLEYSAQVIYAGLPGSLGVVAVEGAAVPGLPSTYFYDLAPDPSIASNGLVAFYASTEPPFSVQENVILPISPMSGGGAIFVGRPGNLTEAVKVGESVPGGPAGSTFGFLSTPSVNALGDIVFVAGIQYVDSFAMRPSIWLKRSGEAPVLLASTGNIFATPTGDQEVTSVGFAGRNAFNDLNQAVFQLGFAGTSGIYLADTRSGYPVIRVTRPAKRADQVVTTAFATIGGIVRDDSGVARVDFTVVSRGEVKAGKGKARKPRKRGRRRTRADGEDVSGREDWSFRVPLEMGRNLVTVWATDKLGNESPRIKFVIIRWAGRDATRRRR